MVRFKLAVEDAPRRWVLTQMHGASMLHQDRAESLTLDAALVYVRHQCAFHRVSWEVEVHESKGPVWTVRDDDGTALPV
jgi:hypothetical protein